MKLKRITNILCLQPFSAVPEDLNIIPNFVMNKSLVLQQAIEL